MPVVFLTAIVCVLNVFMWIVFLVKFKRLFSTDDIVLSTREELNKMIEDLNRNTSMNVSVIDMKIAQLKEAVSEAEEKIGRAERKIEALNSDLSNAEKSAEFRDSLGGGGRNLAEKSDVENHRYFSVARSPAQQYQQNLSQAPENPVQTDFVGSDSVEKNSQQVAENSVTERNAMPEVTYAREQISPKKDFSTSVRELHAQGMDVEAIARALDSTTTEVQFIIDMDF